MEVTQEKRNKYVLGTLISWIYQSSIGLLSKGEVTMLLESLEGERDHEIKEEDDVQPKP